ncbi:MAG: hypothetical protein HYS07_06320 [Chlamydiae bacterium]|nr:hypothetical protein [Chlamydiota bacterium]MBI3277341.1 hypothetical protein [Chlamydiota bacterium]
MKISLSGDRFLRLKVLGIIGCVDGLCCSLSFHLVKFLLIVASSLIKKPPLSNEVLQYIERNTWIFLILYILLNFLAACFKLVFREIERLGYFFLAVTALLYAGGMGFWMKVHGFSLKIFFLLFFFVLWNLSWVSRVASLKVSLILSKNVSKEDYFPPILLRNLPRLLAYFKRRPASLFIGIFMILIILCAIFLAFGKESIAGKLANGSYLCLTTGVLIDFIQIILKRRSDPQE